MNRAQAFSRLYVDGWKPTPSNPYNDTDGRGVNANDIAWWKGTWWMAGDHEAYAPGGGSVEGYGLVYWDWDNNEWVGVVIVAADYDGTGDCLYVWDDGNGERLYYSQTGGGTLADVRKINFAPDTKTVTIEASFGWRTTVGTAHRCYDMLAWYDGQGTNEVQTIAITGSFTSLILTLPRIDGGTVDTDTIGTAATIAVIQAKVDAVVGKNKIAVGGTAWSGLTLTYWGSGYSGLSHDLATITVTADVEPSSSVVRSTTGSGYEEKLYFVGSSSGGAHLVSWDGTTLTVIETTATAGNKVVGLGVHNFDDGNYDNLIICGLFTTWDGVTVNNIAAFEPGAATWNVIGASGLGSLPGGTYIRCVESFNERLWSGLGYDSGTHTSVALKAISNSGGDWTDATQLISNLKGDSIYQYSSGSLKGAGIFSLRNYQDRMYIAGEFFFRGEPGGLATAGIHATWTGRSGLPADTVYRNLPIIGGQALCGCAYDGKLVVAGDYSKSLSGGVMLRNIALWTDPGDPDAEGTWDSLDGGVNGTVYAVCVFDGDLYAAGDFTQAGGVECLGIAKWDGTEWTYVANISDYGTVYSMVAATVGATPKLIVAGDFSAVDGIVSRKIIAAWDGSAWSTVLSDIQGGDPEPIIRVMYVDDAGDYLYIGGYFNGIDPDGLGVDQRTNIARVQLNGSWAWLALQDATLEGFEATEDAQVYSIGEYDGLIIVGTNPGAKGGDVTTAAALWQWDSTGPDWARRDASLVAYTEPVRAIATKAGALTVNYTFHGRRGSETLAPRNRVRDETDGQADIWIGDDCEFESQPSALVWANAGDGTKLYILTDGGGMGSSGGQLDKCCNLIAAITEDDKIIDVAGGVGTTGHDGGDVTGGRQFINRLREYTPQDYGETDDATIEHCPSLCCAGFFGVTGDFYAQFIVGIGLDGRLARINGELAGSMKQDLTGNQDGVRDCKPVPRAEWPAEWTNATYSDMADTATEPYVAWAWLMAGSFRYGINSSISDADAGIIEPMVNCPGLAVHYGGHFRDVDLVDGRGTYCQTAECFDNDLITGGTSDPPKKRVYGAGVGDEYQYLAEPTTAGNMNLGSGPDFMLRWSGKLWMAGFMEKTGTAFYPLAYWNGSAFTFVTPTGFSTGGANYGRHLFVGNVDGTEKLYFGGTPNTAATNPIVATSDGSTWNAVGSNLRGECYSLAAIIDGTNPGILVAQGPLQVDEGAGYVDCDMAYFDGTDWWIAAHFNSFGSAAIVAAASDCSGRTCDTDQCRVIFGGQMTEVAADSADLGTEDGIQTHGMVQWRRLANGGLEAVRFGGGVNGQCFSAGSAGGLMFP